MTIWQGRKDGIRIHHKIRLDPPKGGVGIIGFCSDEGVKRNNGRIGAKEGPDAIRRALANLPIEEEKIIFDCGDIRCDDGDLESAQKRLAEKVRELLDAGTRPIILGGGHEVSWGTYQGLKGPCAIVNIDAHFDLRKEEQSTSGTPFLQIAELCKKQKWPFDYTVMGIQRRGNTQELFDRAKELNVKTIFADEVDPEKLNIEQYEQVYLTICMDVFAAPFAPGVSAPQPLGLLPWQVIPIVRKLMESGKVVVSDIAEMNPKYDHDSRTAVLAASLVAEMI